MNRSSTPPRRTGSIAVVVPAYNAQSTLADCLDALTASSLAPAEIIVFDDGSTDETRAIAAARGVLVLDQYGPPLGPARGRNAAAAAASANYLLFVDADVVVDGEAIRRLADEIANTGAVAAFGSYDDHPRARRVAGLYANLRHHFTHQNADREATSFWSGLGMVERTAFQRLGGFDESFPHPSIEDVELGGRLVRAGYAIRLVPGATGAHCKDWTLLRLWHADIVRRAAPWTVLIAGGGTAGAALNARPREKLASALAWLMLIAAIGAMATPWLVIGAIAAAGGYGVVNLHFFRLLRRRMAPLGFLGAVSLHWLYHLYASATFVVVGLLAQVRSSGVGRPRRDASANSGSSQITRA